MRLIDIRAGSRPSPTPSTPCATSARTSCRGRTHDDDESHASMREIRRYAEAHPDTELAPCHDPGTA
jgi:hypothetical protein